MWPSFTRLKYWSQALIQVPITQGYLWANKLVIPSLAQAFATTGLMDVGQLFLTLASSSPKTYYTPTNSYGNMNALEHSSVRSGLVPRIRLTKKARQTCAATVWCLIWHYSDLNFQSWGSWIQFPDSCPCKDAWHVTLWHPIRLSIIYASRSTHNTC